MRVDQVEASAIYMHVDRANDMTDTKTRILDLAESLTQTKGINGFSYIDLANGVGIKTASVHYYFKLKDDLADALVKRVHDNHSEGFEAIETGNDVAVERLEAVIAYFQNYVAEEKFCLCGMMAAEMQSVSPRVAQSVRSYFADFQKWLERQFAAAGRSEPSRSALSFLSALEGSLLLARLNDDPSIIADALHGFVKA